MQLGVVLLREEERLHWYKAQHLQDKGQQYQQDNQEEEEHPGNLVVLDSRVVQGSLAALGTEVVHGVRDDHLPPTNSYSKIVILLRPGVQTGPRVLRC